MIHILEHTGYKRHYEKSDVVNLEYYKYINKYLCAFVDASKYNYVLLKVFETMSVGTLLLVDESIKHILESLGFYDYKQCIYCNKQNIQDKIKWIIDPINRIYIDIIRSNGQILTRKNHNTESMVKTFIKTIKL